MAAPENDFGNPECYARALRECCRKMSGEHYISESVLELVYERRGEISRTVLVTGLAFQKPGDLQKIGVNSLVGNNLCEKHNTLLSPFDSAGKAMFAAMDALNDAAGDAASPENALRVDGDGLERWLLKSLCGGLYSGAWLITPTETMKGVCPPLEWLQILFRGSAFPPGQGLYYMPAEPGEQITANQYVLRVEPLCSFEGRGIGGLRVWFFGFEFYLLMGNLVPGVSAMFDNGMYRPTGLRAVGSNTQIQFDWRSGPSSDEVVVMHATD